MESSLAHLLPLLPAVPAPPASVFMLAYLDVEAATVVNDFRLD